tara:strand:+ start:3098 stop:3337 length:240 start_codon:yes stop_codon:yes gene_type:complete
VLHRDGIRRQLHRDVHQHLLQQRRPDADRSHLGAGLDQAHLGEVRPDEAILHEVRQDEVHPDAVRQDEEDLGEVPQDEE